MMRDLRIIASTDGMPDLDDGSSEPAAHIRNLRTIMEGADDELTLTEPIFLKAGHKVKAKWTKPGIRTSALACAREHAAFFCLQDELASTARDKLCVYVWNKATVDILDTVYNAEFHATGAVKRIGEWERAEWVDAMKKYRERVMELLPPAWSQISEGFARDDAHQDDLLALEDAQARLEWFQDMQEGGHRPFNIPFLCGTFVTDITNALVAAEPGCKLVSL